MADTQRVPDKPGQPPALAGLSLAQNSQEQIITPFDVTGGIDAEGKPIPIDYNKIVDHFGSKRIDKALLERFEKATGHKPHRLLRRELFFSHRDLDLILDKYEKGLPFFLYTGRGPSSDSMHIGHSIPFSFTKYLQDVFDVPLVIMLTDDEKFLHSPKLTQKQCHDFAVQNVMDVISIGFDIKKTFIFIDSDFFSSEEASAFNANVRALSKRTTNNQIRGGFGFDDSNNIGEFHFPAIQSATAFATSWPFIFGEELKKVAQIGCLIPCAIDQDIYFRQCRDQARPLKFVKPALIHTQFLPSLRGTTSKMSASDPDSSIYMSDTPKQIQKKIGNAFSGGQETRELHRQLGGRTAVDIPYFLLTYFLEDDVELERIRDAYESGEMETGEIKKKASTLVQEFVREFQERRVVVTAEIKDEFLRPRPLQYKGSDFQTMLKLERDAEIKSIKASQIYRKDKLELVRAFRLTKEELSTLLAEAEK